MLNDKYLPVHYFKGIYTVPLALNLKEVVTFNRVIHHLILKILLQLKLPTSCYIAPLLVAPFSIKHTDMRGNLHLIPDNSQIWHKSGNPTKVTDTYIISFLQRHDLLYTAESYVTDSTESCHIFDLFFDLSCCEIGSVLQHFGKMRRKKVSDEERLVCNLH